MKEAKNHLGEKLYEGKAKVVYKTSGGNLVHFYKDSATAFNAEKKQEFPGKGKINNQISSWLFQFLKKEGVPNHFVKQIDERSFESTALHIIPVEVVLRNRVAGSLAKRTGEKEGSLIEPPLVEWFLKDDAKGDPKMSEEELIEHYNVQKEDLNQLRETALKVNEILTPLFAKLEIVLVDFKLEFGKDDSGLIYLADEISPDTCRLWDAQTGEKLDKDRFRFDLGDLLTGYKIVYERLQKEFSK